MVKVWLEERLQALIPALEPLGEAQETEIERLCLQELDAWRARPGMKKETSLRPVVTAARKAIKDRIKLTPANRFMNEGKGEYQHLALKYLNLDWEALNAISDEKFEAGLQNQQMITDPRAIVARAESLLQSSRSDELVVALALLTGRRLTELLKSGRFFPKTAYTLVFDGQLKRRDVGLVPYEIPVLVDAEKVLQVWRKLRSLEDTSKLDNEAVTQRYSKTASESANRHFAGLIPQESERENLFTHAFRAVYAQIAVHWFCPKYVDEKLYANAILGHFQATTERQRRDYLATLHYQHYYIDAPKGVRLEEPGVPVLEVFQRSAKGDRTVSAAETAQDEAQEQQPLEVTPHKNRGTFTTKYGTYRQGLKIIDERGFEGTGAHDRLLVDLMSHDTVAHQMYALLQPLAEELHQEEANPIATLQALIAAYRSGGAAAPGMTELLDDVSDEEKPIEYLRGLVERDRKFQTAIANRHAKVDYATASMADLRSKYKTPEAATERFRRAVDAIMKHNDEQADPLHLWYINAAMVRKLVGGKNELVQAYLKTRQDEIAAHHAKFGLTARANEKGQLAIENDVTVS